MADERLTVAELTARMHEFVASKGWYEATSRRPQTPRNLAVSLSLEAAEVLECFQWSEAYDPRELASELADVCEIDLEQAVLHKLAVNLGRSWTGAAHSEDRDDDQS